MSLGSWRETGLYSHPEPTNQWGYVITAAYPAAFLVAKRPANLSESDVLAKSRRSDSNPIIGPY